MKKEMVLLILIIIAAVALVSFNNAFAPKTEGDARKFFAEDLNASYPNADLREIIDVSKIGEGADSYFILKASVTSKLYTPCPERIEVEYKYPTRNFIKRDEQVVYGCKVCINKDNCHISYPEEAIIASHTYNGTEAVQKYLQDFPTAIPSAQLLPIYNSEKNVWKVDWSVQNSTNSLTVYISQQTNQIISIESPSPSS